MRKWEDWEDPYVYEIFGVINSNPFSSKESLTADSILKSIRLLKDEQKENDRKFRETIESIVTDKIWDGEYLLFVPSSYSGYVDKIQEILAPRCVRVVASPIVLNLVFVKNDEKMYWDYQL